MNKRRRYKAKARRRLRWLEITGWLAIACQPVPHGGYSKSRAWLRKHQAPASVLISGY
jgi:hypothetical protein